MCCPNQLLQKSLTVKRGGCANKRRPEYKGEPFVELDNVQTKASTHNTQRKGEAKHPLSHRTYAWTGLGMITMMDVQAKHNQKTKRDTTEHSQQRKRGNSDTVSVFPSLTYRR